MASNSPVADQPKTVPQVLTELRDLLIAYGKQETIEPLKGLGHFVGFGLAAAIVGATGILMLTLGTMRVLQTHTGGSLGGNWNWVPYVAGLVVLGALIALAVSRINPKGARKS
jgi:hypothetical protein